MSAKISTLPDGGYIQANDNFVAERADTSTVKLQLGSQDIGGVLNLYKSLPQLRGFWPMSSVNESGNVYDLSGQGRTLTNNGSTPFGVDGLVPYADYDGSSQYHVRGTEAGTEITGALTWGCWFNADTLTAANHGLIGKWTPYLLYFTSTGILQAIVDSGGSRTVSFSGALAGSWYSVIGRYTPSTELALFVNGGKYTNTTSIPAALPVTVAQFRIGSYGTNYFDGRITLAFLCAATLSDDVITNLYQSSRGLFGV